jgi:YVTN family beta-propeller protein
VRIALALVAAASFVLVGSASSAAGGADVLARISTGEGSRPCSVAFARGAMWASLFGTGEVVRIDPATNAVVARIKVDSQPCGITAAGGSVWVGNYTGNSVMRIDPATNAVVRRFPVFRVYDVLAGHGSVWATSELGTVHRINPRRNRVTKTFRVAGGAGGLAMTRTAVWVASITGPSLVRIDPRRNRVARELRVPNGSVWLAGSGDVVWVSNGSSKTVTRIDARSNRRVATIAVGGTPADSGIVKGHLWVPNLMDGTLSRIDPATNTVVETIAVGQGPFVVPDHPSEVWSASWGGTEVWRLLPG